MRKYADLNEKQKLGVDQLVLKAFDLLNKSEIALHQMEKDMSALGEVLSEGNGIGVIGFNKCNKFAAQAKCIPVSTQAQIYELHDKLTEFCECLHIPLPAPRSGGGGR